MGEPPQLIGDSDIQILPIFRCPIISSLVGALVKCNVGTQVFPRDPLAVEAIGDPHGKPELGDEREARIMVPIIEEEVGLIFNGVLYDCTNVNIITDQLFMAVIGLRNHLRFMANMSFGEVNGLSKLLGCHVPDGEAF